MDKIPIIFIEMSEKMGKVVALGGFSMKSNVEIAKELGYMKFNPKTLNHGRKKPIIMSSAGVISILYFI